MRKFIKWKWLKLIVVYKKVKKNLQDFKSMLLLEMQFLSIMKHGLLVDWDFMTIFLHLKLQTVQMQKNFSQSYQRKCEINFQIENLIEFLAFEVNNEPFSFSFIE